MVTIITLCVLISNTLLSMASGAKEDRILHDAAKSKTTWSKPNLIRTQRFQMGHANVSFCHPKANFDGSPITMSNSTQDIQSITPVSLSATECGNPKCTVPNFGTPVLVRAHPASFYLPQSSCLIHSGSLILSLLCSLAVRWSPRR
jgi:hypothetical protein